MKQRVFTKALTILAALLVPTLAEAEEKAADVVTFTVIIYIIFSL